MVRKDKSGVCFLCQRAVHWPENIERKLDHCIWFLVNLLFKPCVAISPLTVTLKGIKASVTFREWKEVILNLAPG